MKKTVIKEIGIYLFLLVFLCIWMHYKELATHPIEHFRALPSAPFGFLHPFVFTFIVYIAILIVRIFIKVVKRIKSQ